MRPEAASSWALDGRGNWNRPFPIRSTCTWVGTVPRVAGTGVPGAGASEEDVARTPTATGGARWCLGSLSGFFVISITHAGACVAGGPASTLPDWPAPDGLAASFPSAGVEAVSLALEGGVDPRWVWGVDSR